MKLLGEASGIVGRGQAGPSHEAGPGKQGLTDNQGAIATRVLPIPSAPCVIAFGFSLALILDDRGLFG